MKEIFERRSIRQYTDAPVSQEIIDKLLKAAFSAPSAANRQPWEFVVVQNHDMLEKIAACTPYATPVARAPLAIVVLADTRHHLDIAYDIMDCAAATENMLVEAEHLGLGACWIGFYPHEDRLKPLTALLHVPDYIQPLWVVSIGWPAEEGRIKDKYKPEKVHTETY